MGVQKFRSVERCRVRRGDGRSIRRTCVSRSVSPSWRRDSIPYVSNPESTVRLLDDLLTARARRPAGQGPARS